MNIDYLSPKWMSMLEHCVREGDRLDMGIDMTTGTGWCFGGPQITVDLGAGSSFDPTCMVRCTSMPWKSRLQIPTGNSLTNR